MLALPLLLLTAALRPVLAKYELASYWGQAEDGKERSLGEYCASDEGLDIVIISFLYKFGGGVYPNGYLGDCAVNSDGSFENCSGLADDIQTCKNNGKKVLLSLGGAGAEFSIGSEGDAKGIAYSLWNSYANPASTSDSPRPFGDVFVDGWDFDIESNPNGETQSHLGDLVNALRAYFPQDSSHTYYISGAPQCPIEEPNMGNSMMSAQYDYLFIQFYNNNCAAADLTNSGSNPYGDGDFNLADWPGYLSGGKSAGAKLLVGLPASESAADYPWFYVPTDKLPQLFGNSEGVAGFGGVMLWDAGNSDIPNVNGCNYAQQSRKVLDTGSAC